MADEPATSFRQLIAFLVKLSQQRFFGQVTINFRAGQITTIDQHQTFKATDLPTDTPTSGV